MVSFIILILHEFIICYIQITPLHTKLFVQYLYSEGDSQLESVDHNHEATIAWAAENRIKIDSEKKKTAENKETKANQVLHKLNYFASSQSITLARKAEKTSKVKLRADQAKLDSDLAVEANDYEQRKRGRELAFDEKNNAESNEARKILLELRFYIDMLQYAHDYYEKTSKLKGDIPQ
jgi:hypothetical protein